MLADAGAALVYEEKELAENPGLIAEKIEYLLSEEGREEREGMCGKIKAFATLDANKLIYEDILKLARKK